MGAMTLITPMPPPDIKPLSDEEIAAIVRRAIGRLEKQKLRAKRSRKVSLKT